MIIKAPIDLELTQFSGQTSQPPWRQVDESFRQVVMVDDKPVILMFASQAIFWISISMVKFLKVMPFPN